MAEVKKYPAPVTNPETAQFWEAAKAGKFMIKRCTACGEPHYFPRSICPFCFSDKTVWEESSGEATIYTYSLMRKSPTGPYAIAYVTLKEGPSLQTNIVDCDLEKLKIGQKTLLRLSAFNQRTTPELNGVVTRVSADVTTDQRTGQSYYTIRVSLPPAEVARLGDNVKIIPGMPVEAFVQTGDRTMFSYLMKPFSDQLMRSFRER